MGLGRRTSEQIVQSVRERSDIVSVISACLALKKTGQNYVGLCPFHAEKTPSFSVSPTKQIFHCFGCGEGGDVFHFLMKSEGLSFPQALHLLAERAGVPLPSGPAFGEPDGEREALIRINEAASEYFYRILTESPEAEPGRRYLADRGIHPETIEKFRLGFALPDWDSLLRQLSGRFSIRLLVKAGLIVERESSGYYDRFRGRLIIPIRNLRGEVIAFGGRVLQGDQPKYLNSPETPLFTKGKHLFALDRARGSREESIVLVEGYFDAIVAHQEGFYNVVGTLGTAVTPDHIALLKRICKKVEVIFDPDAAGRRAAVRAAGLFAEASVSAVAVVLPEGEDPDLFIRKRGSEAFRGAIKAGIPLMEFSLRLQAEGSQMGSIDDKIKKIGELFPLIARIQNTLEQDHYLRWLADALNLPEHALRAEFTRLKKTSQRGPSPAAAVPDLSPPCEEELLVHLLLQEPSWIEGMRGIDPKDFMDVRLRRILQHLIDPRVPPPAAGEEGYSLYTELLVREAAYDDPGATLRDCVKALEARKISGNLKRIGLEIRKAEQSGDWEQVRMLQKKIYSIKQGIPK